MWDDNRRANIHITKVLGEERKIRTRYIFEDVLAETSYFLKLVKVINIYIQELNKFQIGKRESLHGRAHHKHN